MELDKYKNQNSEKPILKLREKNPITESKIPGWSTIHGSLADGNEVFLSLPDESLRAAPEKGGYVDLTGYAVIRFNKANKMYLEPLVEKPARATGFQNPWEEKQANSVPLMQS